MAPNEHKTSTQQQDKRDNLSVVVNKKNDLRVIQTPLPLAPGPNEVQIASQLVGICGSDIHFWKDGGIDKFIIKKPMISGHEASGKVIAVGENVTTLKVGDRVAIEPQIACLKCDVCLEGQYNLCENVIFHSCPPDDGSLRRYYNHPAVFCHKFPDTMSYGEGALMEPLNVAVFACRRGNIQFGKRQRVLVTGSGPIGLLSALSAQALGAEKVVITDVNQKRLDIAKQVGIKNTLLVDPKLDVDDLMEQVVEKLGGRPNVTLECTGVESCITLAIHATKDGGTVVCIGLNAHKVTVPLTSAAVRQVDLLGIKRGLNTFPLAIQLVSSGLINVKPLLSHTFKIEDALDAFELARTQVDGAVKVQIDCSEKN